MNKKDKELAENRDREYIGQMLHKMAREIKETQNSLEVLECPALDRLYKQIRKLASDIFIP